MRSTMSGNSGGFGIDTETLLLRQRSGAWMKKQYNLMFLRVLAAMEPIAAAPFHHHALIPSR